MMEWGISLLVVQCDAIPDERECEADHAVVSSVLAPLAV